MEDQIQCQGKSLKRKLRNKYDTSPTAKKIRVDGQTGKGKPKPQIEETDNACSFTTAFEGSLKKLELKARKDQKQDMFRFLRGKTKPILNHLAKELIEKRTIKWLICVKTRCVKPKPDGEDVITEAHFRSSCMRRVDQHKLQTQLETARQAVTQAMVLFQKKEVVRSWMKFFISI